MGCSIQGWPCCSLLRAPAAAPVGSERCWGGPHFCGPQVLLRDGLFLDSGVKDFLLTQCPKLPAFSSHLCSEGCPLLEQLNISWCDQVTKDGVQALVRGCGGLKALSLKGCTQVWGSGTEGQQLAGPCWAGCGWQGLLLLPWDV